LADMKRARRSYSPLERVGLRALLHAVERAQEGAEGTTQYLNVLNSGVWLDVSGIKRKALDAAAKALRQQLQQQPKQGK